MPVCECLIAGEGEVNACPSPSYSLTPLLIAARAGCPAVCIVLLEEGADVHAVTGSGSSALKRAVRFREVATCAVLVAYGAVVSAGLSIPGLPGRAEKYVSVIRDAAWRRRRYALIHYVHVHGAWWK